MLKKIGAISVDRDANDIGAMKACIKALKDEEKLVIFPEGTRNRNEDMQLGEIKSGVAMFAIKTKAPIVPVFINRTPKLFKRTVITIGKPFTLDEFYGKKLDNTLSDQASAIVAGEMEKLQQNTIKSLTKKKKTAKIEKK